MGEVEAKRLLDVLDRAAELGKRTSKPQPALLVSLQGLIVLNESSFLSRTRSAVGSAHLKGIFGGSSGLWLQQARLKAPPELHWRLKGNAQNHSSNEGTA